MTYSDDDHFLPLIVRRIVNRVGRPLGINPFPRAFHYELSATRAEAFDTIFNNNLWGSTESRSGVGSEVEFTDRYRNGLANLLRKQKFTSVFDAPCGDLRWMPLLLQQLPLRYEGGDISSALVESLKLTYPTFNIRVFDITRDTFPEADVWHCRDCLFHLPFRDILAALRNFTRSRIPYALLTSHHARLLHSNLDLNGVGFRFLDLERPPISLPRPLAYVSDFKLGHDFPRYVGLWSREQILQALRNAGQTP